MKKRFATLIIVLVALALAAGSALASEITIGCAGGFQSTLARLITSYETATGTTNTWNVTYANMTALRQNVLNGISTDGESPYDILFSADTAIPQDFVDNYLEYIGDKENFSYAVGQLVLWSNNSSYNVSTTPQATLQAYDAASNSVITCSTGGTYGVAAMEVVNAYGLNNYYNAGVMSQVVAAITSGSYPVGFVGNAQVSDGAGGYRSDYPNSTFYTYTNFAFETPFEQAGVDFERDDQDTNLMSDFIDFVLGTGSYSSSDGPAIIQNYGYSLPQP